MRDIFRIKARDFLVLMTKTSELPGNQHGSGGKLANITHAMPKKDSLDHGTDTQVEDSHGSPKTSASWKRRNRSRRGNCLTAWGGGPAGAAATGGSAGGGSQEDWVKDRLAQWLKDTAKRGLLKNQQTAINTEIDPVA